MQSDLAQAALVEATSHCQALRKDLVMSGPHWATGTGYVDILTRLHRAEEALMLVEPVEDVLDGALYDEQRLQGARMADGEHLLCQLRWAVKKLRPSALVYLNEQP